MTGKTLIIMLKQSNTNALSIVKLVLVKLTIKGYRELKVTGCMCYRRRKKLDCRV